MNIQSLAIEYFRDSRGLSPSIIDDIFTQKDNSWYNLRQISKFSRLQGASQVSIPRK